MSTWLYLTPHYCTLALLHSTWLYLTLPWLYFNILAWFYITLTCLYFTLVYTTLLYHSSYLTKHYSTLGLLTLFDSTLLDHGSTWLCLTLHYFTLALLHSTSFLIIFLSWFYFTLFDSTLLYSGSSSLYLTLHYSTMALLNSTSLYLILPLLYLTHLWCTWLYFTLVNSTM